jgi:hypothetical protein
MAASTCTQSTKQWDIERRLKSWEQPQIDSQDDEEVVLKQVNHKVPSNHEPAQTSLVEFFQQKKLAVHSFGLGERLVSILHHYPVCVRSVSHESRILVESLGLARMILSRKVSFVSQRLASLELSRLPGVPPADKKLWQRARACGSCSGQRF